MPAYLARRYAVATEVERREDTPAAFTWRGRRYLVRAVLDHWWETAAWWAGAAGEAGGAAASDLDRPVGDDEREFWRVEAAVSTAGPASAGPSAVVELCFAWTTGIWTVDTVMD